MCSTCAWESTIERCIDLINDENHRFVFGYDTLTGIKERVAATRHVTSGQIIAVCNIENSGRKRR